MSRPRSIHSVEGIVEDTGVDQLDPAHFQASFSRMLQASFEDTGIHIILSTEHYS